MSKRSKKKKNELTYNKTSLSKAIIGMFSRNPTKTYNYKQIARQLDIHNDSDRKLISEILRELSNQKMIAELYTGKYKLKSKGGIVTGIVDMTNSGYAYIISEETTDDIFVSQKNLKHALDRDEVKVHLYAKKNRGHIEGEVVEIIKRAREIFVGTIEISKNFAFLITESRSMPFDIFIPLEKIKNAQNGQKVIVKITDWPSKAKNPFGEVVDVLGNPGENETEMHAILAEFGLPYKFPDEVHHIAENIDTEITDEEVSKRRDMRKITTFTIDPLDAKDFDDALSLQKLDNGNWEVGVHIADVTHYVKPGSVLESEAYNRATSVYLVDRVVPMLPEKLSNGVCSLRPNEDKLTYAAVFELDEEANIMNKWFGRTVIHSDKRFAYEDAQQVIETGEGDLSNEILTLHNLALKLREKRFRKGAIAFDREEVKFDIDENGKPLGVYFKVQKEANHLIEEFMLLANKKVAEFVGVTPAEQESPVMVYRVHDKPNKDKLAVFNQFITRFGYKINLGSDKKISNSLNGLLADVKGKKEQNLIETLALRSMAKAIYSVSNIGHYGLSFKYYTHFTSPIRRYPDMMVHRLLTMKLNGEEEKDKKVMEMRCKHCSEREQLATDAERASIKYKQVEFMSDKIGQVFEGVISGVAKWGLFVELVDNKCEGLIPMQDLGDDLYELDEENYCIIGRYHKKIYQLGDSIKVLIVKANLLKKQLDFSLVEDENIEANEPKK